MEAKLTKIIKEQFNLVLRTFFKGGYSKTTCFDKDEDDWYLGWMAIGGGIGMPLEINQDGCGTAIVFMWWPQYDDDTNNDEIVGYIKGVMSVIMPQMIVSMEPKSEVDHTMMFKLR